MCHCNCEMEDYHGECKLPMNESCIHDSTDDAWEDDKVEVQIIDGWSKLEKEE